MKEDITAEIVLWLLAELSWIQIEHAWRERNNGGRGRFRRGDERFPKTNRPKREIFVLGKVQRKMYFSLFVRIELIFLSLLRAEIVLPELARHVLLGESVKRTNSEEREVTMNVITQREASQNCDLLRPGDWDSSPTILLVEDEPAVRLVTREALELGGYKVLEANGPAVASQIAQDETTPIDLLLTDVVMPGMNGPELSKLLQTIRPELVTLYMTGYADSELLRVATLGSSQRQIQKPFTVAGLLSRVADALAARWNSPNKGKAPQHPSP